MTNPQPWRVSWRIWNVLRSASHPLKTREVMRLARIVSMNQTSATLCGMARAGYAVAHGGRFRRTWTAGVEPGTRPRKAQPRKRKWTRVLTDTLRLALNGDPTAQREVMRAINWEEHP